MSCCGGSKSPAPQGIIQRAKEAVKNKFADKALREERLSICTICPKLNILKKDYVSMCKVCSCIVEGKTWLAQEKCPLGKW